MDAASAAYEAARIISERGHCKGALTDSEGRYCFNGAVLAAVMGEEAFREWYEIHAAQAPGHWSLVSAVGLAAEQVLAAKGVLDYLGFFPDPVSYNNDPATSAEDVISLLKETAYALENA
jgi:hypothetical protein